MIKNSLAWFLIGLRDLRLDLELLQKVMRLNGDRTVRPSMHQCCLLSFVYQHVVEFVISLSLIGPIGFDPGSK